METQFIKGVTFQKFKIAPYQALETVRRRDFLLSYRRRFELRGIYRSLPMLTRGFWLENGDESAKRHSWLLVLRNCEAFDPA